MNLRPQLSLVELNGINITEHVKQFYGIKCDWHNKNWKYNEIFGDDSWNKRYYIEYTTYDNRKHWTFGFINDINQYFNSPIVNEKINLEKEINKMSI